jgi:D-alanyl-D-alanine carboxypeptidase (penicillin-binding protein 5/6)
MLLNHSMIKIMNPPYNVRPIPGLQKPRRSYKKAFFSLLVICLIVGGYAGYALLRPLPAPKTTILPPVIPAQVSVNIPWPASGQAAFGVQGYGLLKSHNIDKPTPTASVAKVITALSVLQKKPLKPGETGPSITMTAHDVDLYHTYVAEDGAVVPVFEGQTITEYQALQAMMLPSANNMADTTAIWAFGSLDAYKTYANSFVKQLGMAQTTVGADASGFSPTTVSTASDLVRLGNAALGNPVLAGIVGQSEAVFPDYGTISNVNTLLGQYGIRGIKTGNTDEAGGCYLAAADITVAGQKLTVITAIMASSTRGQAMRDSVPIIQSAVSQFQNAHVVRANESVGHVTTAWGPTSDVVANKDITVLTWSGTSLSPTTSSKSISVPAPAGAIVGGLQLKSNNKTYSTILTTTEELRPPSASWRLRHPL